MFETGIDSLDGFLDRSLFSEGNIVLFRGDGLRDILYRLVACNYESGVVIDGSSSIDPYLIGEAGEKIGLSREQVLEVFIVRAFTAHQFYGAIQRVWERSFDVVFLLDPLYLFRDDEINQDEALGVFENCLSDLKEICIEKEVFSIVLLSNHPGRFERILNSFVDEVVFFSRHGDGFKAKAGEDVLTFSIDLDRYQSTIDRYVDIEGIRRIDFHVKSQKKLNNFIEVD